jgi:hypothetical protein
MTMNRKTETKVRTMATTQSDSNKLAMLNTLVLLGGLVVLIISIKNMSGF